MEATLNESEEGARADKSISFAVHYGVAQA
jgi:hypothetical protein